MHSVISAGQYTQVSSDASSGKWEDQVTSGYFDRASREADYELENYSGCDRWRVRRTQVQRKTLINKRPWSVWLVTKIWLIHMMPHWSLKETWGAFSPSVTQIEPPPPKKSCVRRLKGSISTLFKDQHTVADANSALSWNISTFADNFATWANQLLSCSALLFRRCWIRTRRRTKLSLRFAGTWRVPESQRIKQARVMLCITIFMYIWYNIMNPNTRDLDVVLS